ncbi:MAG: hypothetical protein GXO63_01100 [Candidatus Micrarchaeota archaeon]|nr:hypothetical protein [Candidatus Micrarchaeota archaeon]
MDHRKILEYYSRKEISAYMCEFAKNREVVSSFRDGSFSKRPDTIVYPGDIIQKVSGGAVAFHCSVEKWKDPLVLSPTLKDLNSLRLAWDLLIDIDSKTVLEHSAIAASVIIGFLSDLGLRPSVKFSGRRGFHIIVPSECFPKNVDEKPVSRMYPELQEIIIEYIKKSVGEAIIERLAEFEGGYASLSKKVGGLKKLSPYEFIEVEKWGVRHLFRMPYSLHPGTWLVSVPVVDPEKFSPEKAIPEKIYEVVPFNGSGDASELIDRALRTIKEKKRVRTVKTEKPASRIPEEKFPPCIKKALSGLSDGRKRTVFTLVTFLRNMGWTDKEIEEKIMEWNSRNTPPLRDSYIRGQLKWHFRQSRKILPPGCKNELFILSVGLCEPDRLCKGIKNPLNYVFKGGKHDNVSKNKRGSQKRKGKHGAAGTS